MRTCAINTINFVKANSLLNCSNDFVFFNPKTGKLFQFGDSYLNDVRKQADMPELQMQELLQLFIVFEKTNNNLYEVQGLLSLAYIKSTSRFTL